MMPFFVGHRMKAVCQKWLLLNYKVTLKQSLSPQVWMENSLATFILPNRYLSALYINYYTFGAFVCFDTVGYVTGFSWSPFWYHLLMQINLENIH